MLNLCIRFILLLVLMPIAACGPSLFSWEDHPSDAELLKRFQENEDIFDRLVQMSDSDSQMWRIDPTWTAVEGNRLQSEVGFSEDRWNQYRELFKKIDLKSGLTRRTCPGGTVILLTAHSRGMVNRGDSKGYAYAEHPLSPTFESLNRFPYFGQQNAPESGIAFRNIKDNWYLFYDW